MASLVTSLPTPQQETTIRLLPGSALRAEAPALVAWQELTGTDRARKIRTGQSASCSQRSCSLTGRGKPTTFSSFQIGKTSLRQQREQPFALPEGRQPFL